MISSRSKFKNGCSIHLDSKIVYVKNSLNPSCEFCNEDKRKLKEKNFIEKSKKIHKNKYDYSKTFYKTINEKVIIICSHHGEFLQTPGNHQRGQGCDSCLNDSLTYTQSEVLKKFKEIHGETYNYDKVIYVNWKSKVIINCNRHGDFIQQSGKHINGQGCPKCKMSHGERKIEQFLIKNKLQYKHQHTFSDCVVPGTKTRLKFDFFIPKFNLGIEYDGEQHFKPRNFGNISNERANLNFKRIKYLDNLKNDYAKKNNIFLIRIPYKKLKVIDKILSLLLKKYNKNGNNPIK
jgi:hypothetical protein